MHSRAIEYFLLLVQPTETEILQALVTAFAPPNLNTTISNWRNAKRNGYDAPPIERLQKLFEYNNYKCNYCNSQLMLSVDHIDGDSTNHNWENLQPLCRSCNSAVRADRNRREENRHTGAKIVKAIIAHLDEHSEFPDNREILKRSGVTSIPNPELIKWLETRFNQFLEDIR